MDNFFGGTRFIVYFCVLKKCYLKKDIRKDIISYEKRLY